MPSKTNSYEKRDVKTFTSSDTIQVDPLIAVGRGLRVWVDSGRSAVPKVDAREWSGDVLGKFDHRRQIKLESRQLSQGHGLTHRCSDLPGWGAKLLASKLGVLRKQFLARSSGKQNRAKRQGTGHNVNIRHESSLHGGAVRAEVEVGKRGQGHGQSRCWVRG